MAGHEDPGEGARPANHPHQRNPPWSDGPGDQGDAHQDGAGHPTHCVGSWQVRT